MPSRYQLARVSQQSQYSSRGGQVTFARTGRPKQGQTGGFLNSAVRGIANFQTGGLSVARRIAAEYQGDPNMGGQIPIGGFPTNGGLGSGFVGYGIDQCIEAGIPAFLCNAAGSAINNFGGGGGGGGQTTCEPGTVLNPDNGVCEFPNSPGDISTPGGPNSGGARMGVFGAPAVPATVVGEITRMNGQQTLIRRCPRGTVLGQDNLCYAKGSIPNKLRKWPKTARPPVSAYDARMMRRYGPGGSKQKGIKKLAGNAGLSCKKK